MKTVACIIARTGSSRLPAKILKPVTPDHTMIGFIIERIKRVQEVDEIYLCTTREKSDDVLEDVAKKYGVNIYRGSTEVVIERFIAVGKLTQADYLIRITGDNVFTSCEYLDTQIKLVKEKQLDYARIIDAPLGASAEVMSYKALKHCQESIDPEVSEYLLMFMFNPGIYKCAVLKPFEEDYSYLSLTVDTSEDLERTKAILSHFSGNPIAIKLEEIIQIVADNEIPNIHFSMDQKVKMPYDVLMTYRDFKKDMSERESKSIRIELYK